MATLTVRLHGKTLKGKNRVRENGDTWIVEAATDTVKFPNNASKPGRWLLLSAGKDKRWVHETDDQDFIVEDAS